MAVVNRQNVRFGPFELDTHVGELHKHGFKLKLRGHPIQILAMLLERPGELITREEIQQKLWPSESETFVDFEHGLNTAVRKLRKALGDEAETSQYIETLPRRGYRFVGEMADEELVDVPRISPPLESDLRKSVKALPRWTSLVAGGLLLVLAAIAFVVVWRVMSRKTSPADGRRIMLAVLPFENLSGDPNEEFYSDGVTEEMINQLGRLDPQRLGVIAATSAMQYKNSRKAVREIGRELGTDYILEGSVRQGGGRVRISSQLIAASTQAQVWANSYERDSSDILLTQAEIARKVAQQIHLTLGAQAQPDRRVNPEAYSDYLKGEVEVDKWSREGIAKAKAYYERALQKDPDFALAYLGLAFCHVQELITRRSPPHEAAIHAKEAISKALHLDATLGEAYTQLGFVEWQYDWNLAAAEQHLKQASELSPNSAFAHSQYFILLAWMGRTLEARAEAAKARELDPVANPVEDANVWIDYHRRDYGPMVEASRKYVANRPGFWFGHYFLGIAYQGSGRLLEAIPEFQKAVELSGNDSDARAALAYAYALTGKRAEAKKILDEMLEESMTSYVSPYMIAAIYAGLGDKDKAFDFVEQAYNQRSTDLAYFLRADLRMDPLRPDPRFQHLAGRLGLPQ